MKRIAILLLPIVLAACGGGGSSANMKPEAPPEEIPAANQPPAETPEAPPEEIPAANQPPAETPEAPPEEIPAANQPPAETPEAPPEEIPVTSLSPAGNSMSVTVAGKTFGSPSLEMSFIRDGHHNAAEPFTDEGGLFSIDAHARHLQDAGLMLTKTLQDVGLWEGTNFARNRDDGGGKVLLGRMDHADFYIAYLNEKGASKDVRSWAAAYGERHKAYPDRSGNAVWKGVMVGTVRSPRMYERLITYDTDFSDILPADTLRDGKYWRDLEPGQFAGGYTYQAPYSGFTTTDTEVTLPQKFVEGVATLTYAFSTNAVDLAITEIEGSLYAGPESIRWGEIQVQPDGSFVVLGSGSMLNWPGRDSGRFRIDQIGYVSGHFYGPGGKEFAGVFETMQYYNGRWLTGAFGGRRQTDEDE